MLRTARSRVAINCAVSCAVVCCAMLTMLCCMLLDRPGVNANWSMASFMEESIAAIREQVGPEGKVIGAVSGGVDSTVAAVLLQRAIGDRFHAVMVDNGLLRKDEATKVSKLTRWYRRVCMKGEA